MAITRNALLTFAFALTVAASARTAAAGAAKEIMAPANLKPEAARGFERLKGVEITDGEITAVDYGKGGLRVAFVLRPTPKSFIRCELGLADPSKWDGRFWGLGNGGWAGRVSCRRDGVTVYASTDLGTSQYPDRSAAARSFTLRCIDPAGAQRGEEARPLYDFASKASSAGLSKDNFQAVACGAKDVRYLGGDLICALRHRGAKAVFW